MTTALLTAALTVGTPDLSAGLCVGEPDLFEPDDPGLADLAVATCLRCPVLDKCRAWTETLPPNDLHGVVGGRLFEWKKPSLLRKAAAS